MISLILARKRVSLENSRDIVYLFALENKVLAAGRSFVTSIFNVHDIQVTTASFIELSYSKFVYYYEMFMSEVTS